MLHTDLKWQSNNGVYSNNYEDISDKILLVFNTVPPINYQDYKDKYLVFVDNTVKFRPKLLYVDSQGTPNELCGENSKKFEEFSKNVNAEITKRQLIFQKKCDFYILPSLQESRKQTLEENILLAISDRNIVDPTSGEKEGEEIPEGKNAFVMYENKLYLVDRVANTIQKLNLPENGIEQVKNTVGINEVDKSDPMQFKTLNSSELQSLTHLLGPSLPVQVEIKQTQNGTPFLQTPDLPIKSYLTTNFNNQITNLIRSTPGHTHGQYNLYQAEILTDQYPVYHGDTFANAYQTLKEKDAISILDTIAAAVKDTLGNELWYKDKFLNLVAAAKKDKNRIDAVMLVLNVVLSHVAPSTGSDPDVIQKKLNAKLKSAINRLHEKYEVNPRCGRTYLVSPERDIKISIAGSMTEYEKLINKIPPDAEALNYTNIWIVSDVDPAVIANDNNMLSHHQGRSFVCFSQLDALTLIEKLRVTQAETSRLSQSESIHFKEFNGQPLSDYMQLVIAKTLYSPLKHMSLELDSLCKKQQEDAKEYKNRSEALLPKPKMEMDNPNISFNDFKHYSEIGKINEMVKTLLQHIDDFNSGKQDASLPDAIKVNLELVHQSLKNYVETHPYQKTETDILFKMMTHLTDSEKKIAMHLQEEDHSKKLAEKIFPPTQADHRKEKILNHYNEDNSLKQFVDHFINEKVKEIQTNLNYRSLPPNEQAAVMKSFYTLIDTNLKTIDNALKEVGTDDKKAFDLVLKNQSNPSKHSNIADLYDTPKLISQSKQASNQNAKFFSTTPKTVEKPAVTPSEEIKPGNP